MQRRIRQHHADVAETGCDGGCQSRVSGRPAHRRDDDGAGRGDEEIEGSGVEVGEPLRSLDVGRHHRERLGGPVLAAAQLRDGRLVGRVAHEVEAADALDREDRAVVEQLAGAVEGRGHEFGGAVGGRPGAGLLQPQPRAAVEAADRLGVVAAISRVGVLGGAGRAQGKVAHGGVRPVVGQILDDGQPGPAVDARDERVPEAAVGRVAHLGQTVRAGGHVRRQQGARAGGAAGFEDREGGFAPHRQVADFVAEDAGQRRGVVKHLFHERVDFRGLALDLDEHLAVVVAAEARDAVPGGDGGDVRAESHALDHPAQQVFAPDLGHAASLTFERIALTGVPCGVRGCAQTNSGIVAGQRRWGIGGLQVIQIRV